MCRIIGLTGGISTGKSTVAKMFIDEGIIVIDTDKISADLFRKGTSVYNQILSHFGQEFLIGPGVINRKKLAKRIFSNETDRLILNHIVHPQVKKVVIDEIEKLKILGEKIIVVDVPLLFESNFQDLMDKIICVSISYDTQVKRLMERDKVDEDFAVCKISSQLSMSEKERNSDYIIFNEGSILETKNQFNKILKELN